MENVIVAIVGNQQAGTKERELIGTSIAYITKRYNATSYALIAGTNRFIKVASLAGVTGLAIRFLNDKKAWRVKAVRSREDIRWDLDPAILGQSHVILLIGGTPELRQVVKQLQDQGHIVFEATFQKDQPTVCEKMLPDL